MVLLLKSQTSMLGGIFLCALLAVLVVGCDTKKQNTEQIEDTASAEQKIDMGTHPGKALHDAHCISCHDTGAYQDKTRAVSDFPALLAQVKRCNANLNPGLGAEALDQVTDYLNQNFYRYDKP